MLLVLLGVLVGLEQEGLDSISTHRQFSHRTDVNLMSLPVSGCYAYAQYTVNFKGCLGHSTNSFWAGCLFMEKVVHTARPGLSLNCLASL